MTKITKELFQRANKDSGGNQSVIAGRLRVTRGAIHIFLNKNPDMRIILEAEGEKIIDVAENVIDSSIVKDRNIDSAKWKLLNSKRGKERGYGQKNEMEHSGNMGNSYKFEIVEDGNKNKNTNVKQTNRSPKKIKR